MGKTHEIRKSVDIAAPRDAVWKRVSDHEGIPGWGPVQDVKIVEDGKPERGGVGAVRAVKFPRAPVIKERVTKFETDKTYEYKIIAGFPGLEDHLGRVILEDAREGVTRFRWEIDFRFKGYHASAWIATWFVKRLGVMIEAGMNKLRTQLEASHATTRKP